MANLEIAEMCARSGANCGSLFLDLRFRELIKVRFRNPCLYVADITMIIFFCRPFFTTILRILTLLRLHISVSYVDFCEFMEIAYMSYSALVQRDGQVELYWNSR
jgi:hypothetical protein